MTTNQSHQVRIQVSIFIDDKAVADESLEFPVTTRYGEKFNQLDINYLTQITKPFISPILEKRAHIKRDEEYQQLSENIKNVIDSQSFKKNVHYVLL